MKLRFKKTNVKCYLSKGNISCINTESRDAVLHSSAQPQMRVDPEPYTNAACASQAGTLLMLKTSRAFS